MKNEVFIRFGELASDYLQGEWPHDVEPSFDSFVRRKLEMNIEQGCFVWGGRVVIPPNLRQKVLEDLHEVT